MVALMLHGFRRFHRTGTVDFDDTFVLLAAYPLTLVSSVRKWMSPRPDVRC